MGMRRILRALFSRRAGKRAAARQAKPSQSRARPAVEKLEDRTVPSIVLPNPGEPGPVTITGTDRPDQFVIRLNREDASVIEFRDSPRGEFISAALGDVTGIAVSGLGGPDRLVLDNGNGLVAKEDGLTIRFDGGRGPNALLLHGDPGGDPVSEVFTLGESPDAGTLASDDGTVSQEVRFSHLAFLGDSMTAESFTINAGDGQNQIKILNGPSRGQFRTTQVIGMDQRDGDPETSEAEGEFLENLTRPPDENGGPGRRRPPHRDGQQGPGQDGEQGPGDRRGRSGDDRGRSDRPQPPRDNSGPGTESEDDEEGRDRRRPPRPRPAFVPITFANKTNVTVNAQGGNDFILVNNPRPATGTTELNVDGGEGTDALAVRRAPRDVEVNSTNIERTDQDRHAIFVEELYQRFLGRLAADGEVGYWRNILNGPGGQAGVAQGIERSLEARTRLVRDWYGEFLGRLAQGGEENYWVQLLLGGQSEERVLGGILESPEFRNRANNQGDSGSADERFVRALYEFLLDRSAGSNEVQGWIDALNFISRGDVVQGFLGSQEFRTNEVRGFYRGMLNREADQPGLEYWVRSLLDLTQIREGITSSQEFLGAS